MFPFKITSTNIYHRLSALKCLLGAWILALTYTSINVYEDPAVAIGLSFLWIFIVARWLSFFLFFILQKNYRKQLDQITIVKESYKLSLLFGIYITINYLLILLGRRNKFIGIILLWLFIWLEISLCSEPPVQHDK
jgi:hypothetical protein